MNEVILEATAEFFENHRALIEDYVRGAEYATEYVTLLESYYVSERLDEYQRETGINIPKCIRERVVDELISCCEPEYFESYYVSENPGRFVLDSFEIGEYEAQLQLDEITPLRDLSPPEKVAVLKKLARDECITGLSDTLQDHDAICFYVCFSGEGYAFVISREQLEDIVTEVMLDYAYATDGK